MENWQHQVKQAVRSLPDLRRALNLPEADFKSIRQQPIQALAAFPVFVPRPFLSRIRKGDPGDPLLRQVLPVIEEDQQQAGFTVDPLMESDARRGPGVLQKYAGRVLLITTGVCAIHCRYCFRRHFPYQESPKSIQQWQESLQLIAADNSIEEVILSGGDPLMLVDETFRDLVEAIGSIPHVRRLRIHTRLPIMIPQRVNEDLISTLSRTRLKTIVVIHSNHANELDDEVADSLDRLSGAGVMLLNQSVLLRGVNDSPDALASLSQRLIDCGVLPYYLHKNDPIEGTHHFEVSRERGLELIAQMRASLPGYMVPRFVEEIAGVASKTVLG